MHVLRVYVNVPQSYSAQIVPGMTVSLSVPEYPARRFPARLVSDLRRDQRAILHASGGIRGRQSGRPAEAGTLRPGQHGYAGQGAALRLPASALMFRAAGLQVATVDAKDTVVMKPITIGTDLGTQVIVASGLSAGQGDRQSTGFLSNGDKVRVSACGLGWLSPHCIVCRAALWRRTIRCRKRSAGCLQGNRTLDSNHAEECVAAPALVDALRRHHPEGSGRPDRKRQSDLGPGAWRAMMRREGYLEQAQSSFCRH